VLRGAPGLLWAGRLVTARRRCLLAEAGCCFAAEAEANSVRWFGLLPLRGGLLLCHELLLALFVPAHCQRLEHVLHPAAHRYELGKLAGVPAGLVGDPQDHVENLAMNTVR
jgi:hypothetical protein